MDGRFVGDVTACRPEWPIGNAWAVFDDNKVWAACWNGGCGWMAVLSQGGAGLNDEVW